MFSGQPSYDQVPSGKKMYGPECTTCTDSAKKGEFSLAWDTGNNELNDYQRRKQKNKEVAVKLNYQESTGKRESYSKQGYSQEPPFAYNIEPTYVQPQELQSASRIPSCRDRNDPQTTNKRCLVT